MHIPAFSRSLSACVAAAALVAAGLAQAQDNANNPPATRPANTLKTPHNKATSGMQRGADAAGRGIERADDSARRGIQRGSEAASRPVRNVGEAFGRKLAPGSSGRAAPPPVGPQGNAP